MFQPGHALPFPRGQSHNILACVYAVCLFIENAQVHAYVLVYVFFSVRVKSMFLLFLLPHCFLSAAVFQLQRAADPAGLLRVPPHQQHREAGSDAAHPVHFPPAGGVASGGPV